MTSKRKLRKAMLGAGRELLPEIAGAVRGSVYEATMKALGESGGLRPRRTPRNRTEKAIAGLRPADTQESGLAQQRHELMSEILRGLSGSSGASSDGQDYPFSRGSDAVFLRHVQSEDTGSGEFSAGEIERAFDIYARHLPSEAEKLRERVSLLSGSASPKASSAQR